MPARWLDWDWGRGDRNETVDRKGMTGREPCVSLERDDVDNTKKEGKGDMSSDNDKDLETSRSWRKRAIGLLKSERASGPDWARLGQSARAQAVGSRPVPVPEEKQGRASGKGNPGKSFPALDRETPGTTGAPLL